MAPAWAALSVAVLILFFGLSAQTDQAEAAAKRETVTSGPAKAVYGTKRWSFAFRDARRKPVVSERAGTGAGPIGRLGFEVDGTWKHATRVIKRWKQGRKRFATLATTDPARRLRAEISPASHGSIRLLATIVGSTAGVESLGMSFGAPAGQRYLGFGERSNAVNQRGNVVENWTGEGPYEANEYPLIKSFVPEWALRDRADATYFPMPWLLSSSGYGVLVENSEPSYFHLGTDRKDVWRVELVRTVDGLAQQPADAPSPRSLSLRFFAGPKPADVVRRLSGALGRQPQPAGFFFGPWVQPKGDAIATVDKLTQGDIPTSLLQTYLHYLPCQHQQGQEQAQRDFTGQVHSNGMAITAYFNPMLCADKPLFDELATNGGLTKNRSGDPYEYDYLSYHVGQFDFTSQNGREAFGGLLREALDHGYDGWMEDFGEYTPPDGVSADGTPGMVEHNAYPRRYHCTAHEETKAHASPVARFTRSGFTGSAACSPIVWGGDPNTEWDFDGLRSAVQNGLTLGLSGVGVWGSDIGGFFSLLSDPLSPELLTRWVQFGAFSGVMRSQADGLQIDSRYRPQVLDPDQIDNWRRYSKLRTQLYPYIRAAAREYRENGLPMMRAMVLGFPEDRRASGLEDQYMFGPDLLVAPVVTPGATSRKVYLPHGKWIDFWRTFGYDEASGRFAAGAAKLRNGGGWRTLPAPAEEIPLLLRAGAMITGIDPDVATLAPFGDDRVVNLEDRDRRTLFAFPNGSSTGRFEESGRIVSKEGRGSWKLSIRDARKRSWRIEAATGSMKRPFRVRCVKLNGRRLAAGAWTAKPGRVELDLPARKAKTELLFLRKRCG